MKYPGLDLEDSDLNKDKIKQDLEKLIDNSHEKLEDSFNQMANMAKKIIEDASGIQRKLNDNYAISRIAAPRFWQPNDPVVLLAGTDVNPSQRYGADSLFGEDGQLHCRLDSQIVGSEHSDESTKLPSMDLSDGLNKSLFENLIQEAVLFNSRWKNLNHSTITDGIIPASLAMTTWGNAKHTDRNAWHPLFMHWEINTTIPNQRDEPENKISSTVIFPPHALDLVYKDNLDVELNIDEPYQGIVLLSAHPAKLLMSQLEKLIPAGVNDGLKEEVGRMPMMSQQIRGFNDSLLMREQQNQFQIEDPYIPIRKSHRKHKHRWQKVRDAVGSMNIAEPLPFNRFAPIRSGFGEFHRLWLVDAFGQYKGFTGDELKKMVPSTMKLPKKNSEVDFSLSPRVVQPCRLQMRWVSANDPDLFMNAHPNTTPICGWVLPNHLDHSLMVYDNAGKALGALRANVPKDARWSPAPGVLPEPDLSTGNKTLFQLVKYLKALSEDAFSNYLKAIEQVLLTIEPPSYREHNALSVLMGRPLALAQLHLSLELKGAPAIDQAYNKIKSNDSDKFTEVKFPVRLGDVVIERDGMVCAFTCEGETFKNHHLEVDAVGKHIRGDGDDFWLSLSESSKNGNTTVPVLLDPRASVHATTGFLPIQKIAIPPEYYTDTIQQMAFTFLVNPILSTDTLKLPLPT
jgi:hypothetical protein